MQYYAVIDTNVLISALLSKNEDSATVKVFNAVLAGDLVPLYCRDIMLEYDAVLHRSKFHFKEETIHLILLTIKQLGVEVSPLSTNEIFIDKDDAVFYETALARRYKGAYLVTGNKKHYPFKPFIKTPLEMVNLLESLM